MSLTVHGGYGPVSWDHPALEHEEWRQYWWCTVAAVSEGFCPVHEIPLEAVSSPPGRIAGHCTPCCRFWGLNLDSMQTGWWLDHDSRDPGRPSVVVPDWMDWRYQ